MNGATHVPNPTYLLNVKVARVASGRESVGTQYALTYAGALVVDSTFTFPAWSA